jgi:non-canonical purine NTP pyrophosphatase (RdgB/HAM1 family)
MLESLENKGLFELVSKYKDRTATVKTIIGYTNSGKIMFFEGVVDGMIVSPKGENGFGFDKIFLPNNNKKTFAEMELEEKTKLSPRKIAAEKLKEFLGV